MADAGRLRHRAALAGCVLAAPLSVVACSGGGAGPAPTAAATVPVPVPAASAAPVALPYTPAFDPEAFTADVDNPHFPLRPGMRWEYRSVTGDGVETTVVLVTAATRTIRGVTCVEVRDTVRLDGEVVEDTLDWYAQHRDGTVWYFGEDTKEYESGTVSSTKGSWEAGVNGAEPGIVMPADPRVGDRYRQEYLRGAAEDVGEVVGVGGTARVPAGSYRDVVTTRDTTALEPQVQERKYYAPGVGPVLTVDLADGGTRDELVRFTG